MLSINTTDLPPPLPPESALVSLVESPYGFCFVDVGITSEDLFYFDALQIAKSHDYNQFGPPGDWEREIAQYLREIGPNDPFVVEKVAKRVNEIATRFLQVSGKEMAWICLRAATPNHQYDIPRWHMDGHYYANHKTLQYKFALTLQGPSTLFFPIPTSAVELRRVIWMHMGNRKFMSELCAPEYNLSPHHGEGALFIAGHSPKAAVHSEPKTDQNRLFFSLVPCDLEDLDILKEKVMHFYKYKSSVNP